MKSNAFYEISETDEKKLFEDSLIFFDTSSLLDFFYFTNENLNELVEKLFEPLKERLWICSHSEYEFLKNKKKVRLKPIDTYNSLINKIKGNNDSGHIQEIEAVINGIKSKINDEIRGHLKTLQEKVSKNNKHPYLEGFDFSIFNTNVHEFEKSYQNLNENFNKFKESIIKKVEEEKSKIKNEENRLVIDIIDQYFNVTKELSYSEVSEIVKEGEFRYSNTIPPGYMDKTEKTGFQIYGDLIMWKEILSKSSQENKNLILVINDLKEDWWYLDEKNNHLAPRYELIKEFQEICKKRFWMYEISDFLYKTNKYISTSIDNETIEEIKSVTDENKDASLELEFIDWIFDYLEIDILREIMQRENETHDFECEINEEIIYKGYIKKISSHIYTKLMLPIKNFCNNIQNPDDTKELLIIEYNDPELISTFYNHISHKRTLRKLISTIDASKKRIIVTLNYNETYSAIFDSKN